MALQTQIEAPSPSISVHTATIIPQSQPPRVESTPTNRSTLQSMSSEININCLSGNSCSSWITAIFCCPFKILGQFVGFLYEGVAALIGIKTQKRAMLDKIEGNIDNAISEYMQSLLESQREERKETFRQAYREVSRTRFYRLAEERDRAPFPFLSRLIIYRFLSNSRTEGISSTPNGINLELLMDSSALANRLEGMQAAFNAVCPTEESRRQFKEIFIQNERPDRQDERFPLWEMGQEMAKTLRENDYTFFSHMRLGLGRYLQIGFWDGPL